MYHNMYHGLKYGGFVPISKLLKYPIPIYCFDIRARFAHWLLLVILVLIWPFDKIPHLSLWNTPVI